MTFPLRTPCQPLGSPLDLPSPSLADLPPLPLPPLLSSPSRALCWTPDPSSPSPSSSHHLGPPPPSSPTSPLHVPCWPLRPPLDPTPPSPLLPCCPGPATSPTSPSCAPCWPLIPLPHGLAASHLSSAFSPCLCTRAPLLAPRTIPLPSAGASPTPPHPTVSFTTWALWTPLRPPLFLSCIIWDPGTPSHPTPSQSSPRTPSSASFPSPACSGPLRPRLDPLPSSPLHSGPLGRCPGTSSPSPPSPFGPHSDPSLPRPHALRPLGPPLRPACPPVTICPLPLPLTTAHPRTTLGSHLTHSLAVSPPQTPFSASFPLPAHPGPLGPPSDHPLGLVCQLAAFCSLSAPLQPTSPSPSPLWALGPLPPLSAPSASPSWPCGPTRHPRCLSLPPLPLPP